MRIAINITHPAHFHFFRNAIAEWLEQDHDVLLLSRDKDLTIPLLDEAGWNHSQLSRARRGLFGLGIEFVQHGTAMWRALGRHRSQVVAAIGGTFIVHAARLRGIPSLVFYDTENATLSNRITYPFATRVYTPRSYRHDIGLKQVRYDGFQELAYLYPTRFTPDPEKLAVEGMEPGEPFTFVRLVAWTSHHDVGDFGVRDLREVIQRLEKHGRVLISSESSLPEEFEHLALKGPPGNVHHILSFAQMTFGESATMASEGAQLGVPGVFLSSSSRGYTDELEDKYGMLFNFNGAQAIQADALNKAEEILTTDRSEYQDRHAKMMDQQIDVTQFIMDAVEEHARR